MPSCQYLSRHSIYILPLLTSCEYSSSIPLIPVPEKPNEWPFHEKKGTIFGQLDKIFGALVDADFSN